MAINFEDYDKAKKQLEEGYVPPKWDEEAKKQLDDATTISIMEGRETFIINSDRLPDYHPFNAPLSPRTIISLYNHQQLREHHLNSNGRIIRLD